MNVCHTARQVPHIPKPGCCTVRLPVVSPVNREPTFRFRSAPDWLRTRVAEGAAIQLLRTSSKSTAISDTDKRVHTLPDLPICPNVNSVSCRCEELSHGSSPDFQRDIRALYCLVIQKGNRKIGNAFLMSCMVPRPNSGTRHGFVFKVPGFVEEGLEDGGGVVRVFYVCQKQFMALFGMGTKRLYQLIHKRQEDLRLNRERGINTTVFGWSEDGGHYMMFGKRYKAFRSSYWVDSKVKSGEYETNEIDY